MVHVADPEFGKLALGNSPFRLLVGHAVIGPGLYTDLSLDRGCQGGVDISVASETPDMSSQFTRRVKRNLPPLVTYRQADAGRILFLNQRHFVHRFEVLIVDLNDVEKNIPFTRRARRDLNAPLSHQCQTLRL